MIGGSPSWGGAKAALLWSARNKLTALHKSNLPGDIIHLQQYGDNNVNMRHSLAALLNAVGKTKWQSAPGGHYKSNLGLGTSYFDVGTAKQIWNGSALVTKEMIAKGRNEAKQKTRSAGTKQAEIKQSDIRNEEVTAVQAVLQNDFKLAEQNRSKWNPTS